MFGNLGNSCFKEQRTMTDRLNETPILFSVRWAHQTWSIQIINVYLEGNGYFCHHIRTPNGINGFGHGETFSTMEGVQENVAYHLKEAPPVIAQPDTTAHELLQSKDGDKTTAGPWGTNLVNTPMLFTIEWATKEYDILRLEVYYLSDAKFFDDSRGKDGYLCHYTDHLITYWMAQKENYVVFPTMEKVIDFITDMLMGNQPIAAQPNTVAHAMLSITGG